MTTLDLTTIALAATCSLTLLLISGLIMADGARILPPIPRLPRPRLPRRRRLQPGRHSTGTWRPARPGDTPGQLTPEHGPAHPITAESPAPPVPDGGERRRPAVDDVPALDHFRVAPYVVRHLPIGAGR